MLGKEFFLTESHNPDFPPENYDVLVYENTSAGNYTQSLSWGKYKIVFSGGGGSGGSVAYGSAEGTEIAYNGNNGQEKTVYVSVGISDTKTISGIIGSGGNASSTRGLRNTNTTTSFATAGNAGTGYANGTKGGAKVSYAKHTSSQTGVDGYAAAGGAGGGSTSLEIDGVLDSVAAGGNGGAAYLHIVGSIVFGYSDIGTVGGGTGGSGGTSSGTGAGGGSGVNKYEGTATSGAGSSGYVRIYKSNLKPEPI